MKKLKLFPWTTAAIMAGSCLAGCARHRERRPMAPRLTLRQQVRAFNARADAMRQVRAIGSVTLSYIDRYGNPQVYQAQGTLLVDQSAVAATDAGFRTRGNADNMLLVGRYLGKDVFELGMNARHYWIIQRTAKNAVVGSFADPPPSARAFPLFPGRLLRLLAITPIKTGRGAIVRMAYLRGLRANVVRIYRRGVAGNRGSVGRPSVRRAIAVSCRTGLPIRVDLFGPRGSLTATASLRDYKPLKTSSGRGGAGQMFPRRIVIHSPVRHSTLSLSIHIAQGRLGVNPRIAFALPNLAGLRVQTLRAPAPRRRP